MNDRELRDRLETLAAELKTARAELETPISFAEVEAKRQGLLRQRDALRAREGELTQLIDAAVRGQSSARDHADRARTSAAKEELRQFWKPYGCLWIFALVGAAFALGLVGK